MTISAITLTNPGAETGDTTGWTVRSGGMQSVTSGFSGLGSPHSGSRFFSPTSGAHNDQWDQQITVDGAYFTAIDAGNASVVAAGWMWAISNFDIGALYIEAYDSGVILLDRLESVYYRQTGGWFHISLAAWRLPANTRYLRIGSKITYEAGFNADVYWDDYTLTISDDAESDYPPNAYQLGTYAWGSQVADEAQAYQLGVYTFAASETSSGLYQVRAYQLGAYAWVRATLRRRRMQAWTFSLDGHDFYVLNLAGEGTIVYDLATGQWSEWRSPDQVAWRARIGQNWLGIGPDTVDRLFGTNVVVGDDTSGILWILDPTQGFDDATTAEGDDTPFIRYVTGMVPMRMRATQSCAAVYVNISLGAPTVTGAAIQLRTSDDGGQTYYDHGSVTITPGDYYQEVSWRGLGLIRAQGRVFEITDSGAAVRINSAQMK